MDQIKLYRASAGSGKTYRLSLEFLKLLVVDPYVYDKILAVTFTNKATTEMQTRIMADLYAVAYMGDSLLDALLLELAEEQHITMGREQAQKNAKKALLNILHDYSRFQVSTIDSFFQIILRNFAHELGLGAYLNLIIDEKEPLEDAVRLLKEDVSMKKSLRQWMNEYSQEKMDGSLNWDLTNDLCDFGKNIFKESYKRYEGVIESELKNEAKLKKFKGNLYALKAEKKVELQMEASKFELVLSANGLSVSDLANKEKGVFSFVNKILKWSGVVSLANSVRAFKGVVEEDLSMWATKSSAKKADIEKVASIELIPFMKSLEKLREKNMLVINTCSLMISQVNNVGLIRDIAQKNREINSSRGQFLLSDTSSLLREMIKDSDTPFIYEKIGTVLEHIMIDEFQDTSETQWENFKPLIDECVANFKTNLIVGDAKQSIYRFRNGDWRIIESLNDFFKGKINNIPASGNWRSLERVIEFNNFLFSQNPQSGCIPMLTPFEGLFSNNKTSEDLFRKLFDVYKNSSQICPKAFRKEKGYVSVEFVKKEKNVKEQDSDSDDEESPEMLEQLLKRVLELQKRGVQASDITILVRVSKHINAIANYFSLYRDSNYKELNEAGICLDIISDEAYLLSSSEALCMVIDAMRVIDDPEDISSMMELYYLYKSNLSGNDRLEEVNGILSQVSCKESSDFINLKEEVISKGNLPLYELAEELIRLLQVDRMDNQSSFLSKFLDLLSEFVGRKSPDLKTFIDYWDKYLKDKKIPMGDEAQGIKIMTIHKSKGLEFHTVIVPFCNGSFFKTGGSNNLIWCEIPKTQGNSLFNQYSYWPIDMKKKEAAESIFADYYQEEQVQLLADSINVLYVAFTRPICNLLILCDEVKGEKKEAVPTNCSELLRNALKDGLYVADEEGGVVVGRYESGAVISSKDWVEINNKEKKTSAKVRNEIDEKDVNEEKNPFKVKSSSVSCKFNFNERNAKFKSSNKANEYVDGMLDSDMKGDDARKKGVLLHYLFSNIATEDDIASAAIDMLINGMITSEEEKNRLVEYAKEKISEHPEWFRKGLKIYNECTILSLDNKNKVKENRPDRVIWDGGKMIIIDFKTGAKSDSYQRQIERYADLLKKMGYETETHLWYI